MGAARGRSVFAENFGAVCLCRNRLAILRYRQTGLLQLLVGPCQQCIDP